MKKSTLFCFLFFLLISSDNQITKAQTKYDNDSSTLPYKYFGNSFSNKFHRPSCLFGKAISSNHLILFHFRKEAIEAHYKPCRYCLPPVWLSTHCLILQTHAKTTCNNSLSPQSGEECQGIK